MYKYRTSSRDEIFMLIATVFLIQTYIFYKSVPLNKIEEQYKFSKVSKNSRYIIELIGSLLQKWDWHCLPQIR